MIRGQLHADAPTCLFVLGVVSVGKRDIKALFDQASTSDGRHGFAGIRCDEDLMIDDEADC